MICYQVCTYMEALEEPIMVEDSDNDILQDVSAENLDLMNLVESSGNKLLPIPRPIHTPGMATN